MTELDLICEEPIKIGLIGSMSFLSFSLGSVLLTKEADKHGRKKTVLYTGIVTPICIFLLIYIKLNLNLVYLLIFPMAITYNARSAVAYLYNSELMETNKRIYIGTCVFGFSGFYQAFTAWWFWYTKDQWIYSGSICVGTFIALMLMQVFIPESPLYLYEKENFIELRKALSIIGSYNGVANLEVKVDYCMLRLKLNLIRKNEEKG